MTTHQSTRTLKNLKLDRQVLKDPHHFFCKRGVFGTLDFRIEYYRRVTKTHLYHNDTSSNKAVDWQRISPWHHLPLFQVDSPNGTLQIVEEEDDTLPSSHSIGERIIEELDDHVIAFGKSLFSNELTKDRAKSGDDIVMEDTHGEGNVKTSVANRSRSIAAASFLSMPNILINMIVEIPKLCREKMEVATCREGNPLMQDSKNGKPRLFHAPMYWNYGAIPQTWENPTTQGQLRI